MHVQTVIPHLTLNLTELHRIDGVDLQQSLFPFYMYFLRPVARVAYDNTPPIGSACYIVHVVDL